MTTEAAGPPRAEGPENRARFERLLAQHAPGVVAVLRRLVRRADRVDDALQQALLQAWAARERYDAARPFGPWLRAIAVRVAHDQRRAEARRHDRGTLPGAAHDARSAAMPDAMPDAMNQVADPARAHEATAEVEDEVARLRRELVHLSATTRRVFTMFYDEERPVAAIATALVLPVNTVKTHLHRARQELARRLRDTGDRT